jgi:hypothetical protein
VHVLKKVYRWLRRDGLLLDLHPESQHFKIDVHLADDKVARWDGWT